MICCRYKHTEAANICNESETIKQTRQNIYHYSHLIVWLLNILRSEGDDDDGDEDDEPDQVADGQQGGGHNAVVAAHAPPPVVEDYPWHCDCS